VIHYHGTPFSGDYQTAIQGLTRRHAMISYADTKHLEIAAEVCQSFTFDNGAFTAWKKGTQYDIEGYARWIDDWYRHPAFDWYIIPDVIDGTEQDNRVMRAAWHNHCPQGAWELGVPVWHMHESLEELAYLVSAYKRLALGSSGEYATVGDTRWWNRMNEAMHVICDDQGRPKTKLHGLRMLDPTVFSHLPLASADSTNVARNIGIDKAWSGTYAPQSKSTRAIIMTERIEVHCSAARWMGSECGVQQNLGLFG
jgi:hypothetical protein